MLRAKGKPTGQSGAPACRVFGERMGDRGTRLTLHHTPLLWVPGLKIETWGTPSVQNQAIKNSVPHSFAFFAKGWEATVAILFFLSLALAAAAQSSPAARFTVVLDAAHGGDDAGAAIPAAKGQAKPEKDIVLALSVRLRSLLAARGIAVVTTRESDAAVDPQRRVEITSHAGASACLSLHATDAGSGVHLFLTSLGAAQSQKLAAWKTAQAAWAERSVALAGVLNSALDHAGVNVTLSKTALPVVDSMACPAVAVEIAPEGGPNQNTSPADTAYQARVAEALAAGLLEWRTEARQP